MGDDVQTYLDGAADALNAFSSGPVQSAATALETAFVGAGDVIANSLAEAARSGELDFTQMAETALRQLARIMAESVLARGAAQSLTLNLTAPSPVAPSRALANRGALTAALTRLLISNGDDL